MNDEDCVDYEEKEKMERYAMHLPMRMRMIPSYLRMIGMTRMRLIVTFPYCFCSAMFIASACLLLAMLHSILDS